MPRITSERSLESWIWDAACSIRGAKDAPKYKDYILPLIFTKRLCDVFDDELTYRPIAEIVSELAVIEKEARETDRALQRILKQLGVGA
jgi:type I restriction-modification system DNA methylase subunit